mmetsp:Transcript_117465/g.332365  ORF Transcript_117465/g.332365 Transcript_117465/m.332365 type:complete len:276 (-) Transcript_117465:38-865(-)
MKKHAAMLLPRQRLCAVAAESMAAKALAVANEDARVAVPKRLEADGTTHAQVVVEKLGQRRSAFSKRRGRVQKGLRSSRLGVLHDCTMCTGRTLAELEANNLVDRAIPWHPPTARRWQGSMIRVEGPDHRAAHIGAEPPALPHFPIAVIPIVHEQFPGDVLEHGSLVVFTRDPVRPIRQRSLRRAPASVGKRLQGEMQPRPPIYVPVVPASSQGRHRNIEEYRVLEAARGEVASFMLPHGGPTAARRGWEALTVTMAAKPATHGTPQASSSEERT